ncbi:hypothetical protein J2045_001933 [Peteryoungia aggregata LMG 23059]|uniref:Uncharacterized protein n=1 Tax=Peteryoungia aggregata LMG 23059 TaxID=1368425 RepID=A0ABU0G824_9HYPH|nr:hypothetical protein [Peteryoungia aggregata]MDQ0420906.1 hypothetical protein [Peteryoungia aggregata LMG 23059]
MTEKTTSRKPWRINWLFTAGFFTAVYLLALAIYLIPETALCGADGNLVQRLLACRSFNELGDFLSRAFAPVAFLWLVAAVFIQAQELRAQREELVMTRQELANSREVMKEQAEQARNQALQAQRQADFIGEQTENLRRQSEDAHRERQDRVFEELLQATHRESLSKLSGSEHNVQTNAGLNLSRFSDFRAQSSEKAFSDLSSHLEHLKIMLRALSPTANWRLHMPPLVELCNSLNIIVAMERNLSPAGQVKMNSLGLKSIQNSIKEIIDIESEFNSKQLTK